MTISSRTRVGKTMGLTLALSHAFAVCGVAEAQELTAEQKAAVTVAQRAVAGSNARGTDLQVRSVEARQWSSSALGCPQPGMTYLTVITEGYLVTLEGQGQVHEVHVAGENAVICPTRVAGQPRVPAATPRVTNLDLMEKNAVTDLAQRLGVDLSTIRITARIPQTWEDASLGCSAAAPTPKPATRVAGFKLALVHEGRVYTYHTDLARVMACPPIESQ